MSPLVPLRGIKANEGHNTWEADSKDLLGRVNPLLASASYCSLAPRRVTLINKGLQIARG
jgi:hypothetical protein